MLNRPLDTKHSITKRPRKTSRHHRSQRSELENRIPNPTSGHLKVEILIRPLDTKKKMNDEVVEIGLGILGFIIRTLRRAQEKHAKYVGFFVF